MNTHPIWVVNDFSLQAAAHKLSECRVLTLPLRIVVLNAELLSGRKTKILGMILLVLLALLAIAAGVLIVLDR
jgi:hypothetical protein